MIYTLESPFTIDIKDRRIIEDKIDSLSTYEDRIVKVEVFFKAGDGTRPNAILAQIRVHVPGEDLFAEDKHEDAMKAFVAAFNAVKRQVKKRRSKLNHHQSHVKEISELVNNTYGNSSI